jgi:hypothetical protein
MTTLIRACETGDYPRVETILQHAWHPGSGRLFLDLEIKYTTFDIGIEVTPLLMAILKMEGDEDTAWGPRRSCQLRIIKMLIDHGANPLAVASTGETGLHFAVKFGCLDMILENTPYVNVDVRDALGRTPLYLAAKEGSGAAIDSLLQRGADPKTRAYNGNTILHQHLNNPTAKKFINLGVDLNDRNGYNGSTPLHHAIYELQRTVVIIEREMQDFLDGLRDAYPGADAIDNDMRWLVCLLNLHPNLRLRDDTGLSAEESGLASGGGRNAVRILFDRHKQVMLRRKEAFSMGQIQRLSERSNVYSLAEPEILRMITDHF